MKQEYWYDKPETKLDNVSHFMYYRIRDHHNKKEKAQLEDAVEGEELQKLAIQNKLEKERLEAIRRDEKQQLMDDNRKQIQERAALKKLQENQEDVRS